MRGACTGAEPQKGTYHSQVPDLLHDPGPEGLQGLLGIAAAAYERVRGHPLVGCRGGEERVGGAGVSECVSVCGAGPMGLAYLTQSGIKTQASDVTSCSGFLSSCFNPSNAAHLEETPLNCSTSS